MLIDFAITQFYRYVADDLILMYDVYLFYSRYKKANRSLKEFAEVLANLIQVEAQNFEDIDETKLSCDSEERVEWMVRDYLMSVVVRYVLDDLSQFPYWSAKINILFGHEVKPFGREIIKEFWDHLKSKVLKGQLRSLYEGVGPYLYASFIINFDYISKSTHNFIIAMLSKFPQPPITPPSLQDSNPVVSNSSPIRLPKLSIPATIQTLKGSPGKNKQSKKGFQWMEYVKRIVIQTLSHPFLVLSVSMVSDPLLKGDSWLYAYVKFVSNYGIAAFYNGLRTRVLFGLLPISPIFAVGLSDTIIYRRILNHRIDLNEDVFSVAREITNTSRKDGNSLFNYGLLTAIHVLPGFATFVGMRLLAWLTFGSSNHRKHQILRRKEIVQAHILKLKKRSSRTGMSPKSPPL